MLNFQIGTSLIDVINKLENIEISPINKEMILNFCREELEHGDSKISNNFELQMINSWLNDESFIKMPLISDDYVLTDSFSSENNGEIRNFEEYKSKDGSYYVRCTTYDKHNNIRKIQLSYMSKSLKDIILSGGVEDIFIDNNGDGIVNSRIVQKHSVKDDKSNDTSILYDVNIDGKFD